MLKSSKENVYKILKSKLIMCEIAPGTALREKELMSEYGIGRTPLRDVFMRLGEDGLINTVPQSGTFVKNVDLNELRDVIEMRIPLEGLAARVIPHRITSLQLEEIRFAISCFEKEKEKGLMTYIKMKIYMDKLHDIYYHSTNNAKLTHTLITLHNFSARAWYTLDFIRADIESNLKEWKEVERLITNKHETELEVVMQRHVISFANTLNLDLKYSQS